MTFGFPTQGRPGGWRSPHAHQARECGHCRPRPGSRDLEAAIAFFTELGLTVVGRDTVSGEWTDTAVGLDGNHAKIAMLQTPDGNGRLELAEEMKKS